MDGVRRMDAPTAGYPQFLWITLLVNGFFVGYHFVLSVTSLDCPIFRQSGCALSPGLVWGFSAIPPKKQGRGVTRIFSRTRKLLSCRTVSGSPFLLVVG